ncbi:hypothetical protein [Pseudorhodoferax sp.]|uniref:hypothetical protein n=1 Tax=Pseudorhodoferax sp. TaxID=1993553 RepID=UPI0039E5B02E
MRAHALSSALCVALAGLVAAPAGAGDLVVNQGRDSIRLRDGACTSRSVLQHIDPAVHPRFRTATATLQGQRYTACWSLVDSVVYLVYEDGDQGLVPLSQLKVPVDI